MGKKDKRKNRKKPTPYDVVANMGALFIADGIIGLVLRIMYMDSEGLYFSTIVMAISSLFLLFSGIAGLEVRKDHEKLSICFKLFLICVIAYAISLVIMWTEDVYYEDFGEILSGIITTVFAFLIWGFMIARAYMFKRKGGTDKEGVEEEAKIGP